MVSIPSRPTGVADTANAAGITEIDIVERPSSDIVTRTITSDPGAAGTTLNVDVTTTYKFALFPTTVPFKIRVEAEVMTVTAVAAGVWTITRGVDGTTGAAHAIGTNVAYVVGVQRVEPIDASRIVTYKGRASTFRIPGLAGTAGQKILSIHNATGSAVKVRVNRFMIDVTHAAAAGVAPTVLPAIVRLWKVTVLPSGGAAVTKTPMDSALSSNASVTVLQGASADGTGATLAATLPAGTIIAQEFIPRTLVVGTSASTFTELFDRETFLDSDGDFVTLNALEGMVLFLDYTLATQNPATDHYVATVEWEEYSVS